MMPTTASLTKNSGETTCAYTWQRKEMKKVIIELTPEQSENLEYILWRTQDEGPDGEGWASDELQELRDIVEEANLASRKKK